MESFKFKFFLPVVVFVNLVQFQLQAFFYLPRWFVQVVLFLKKVVGCDAEMEEKVKGGKVAPWMDKEHFKRFEQQFYKDEGKMRRRNGS